MCYANSQRKIFVQSIREEKAEIPCIACIFACQKSIRLVCARVCAYLISLRTMSQKRQPVGVGFYYYIVVLQTHTPHTQMGQRIS